MNTNNNETLFAFTIRTHSVRIQFEMTLQQQVIVKRKLQSFHGKYKLNKNILYGICVRTVSVSGYYYHQLHRLAFSVLHSIRN